MITPGSEWTLQVNVTNTRKQIKSTSTEPVSHSIPELDCLRDWCCDGSSEAASGCLCPSRPTQYCSPMDPASCSSCPGGALVDAGRRFSALKEKDLNWTPPIAAVEAIGNLCAFLLVQRRPTLVISSTTREPRDIRAFDLVGFDVVVFDHTDLALVNLRHDEDLRHVVGLIFNVRTSGSSAQAFSRITGRRRSMSTETASTHRWCQKSAWYIDGVLADKWKGHAWMNSLPQECFFHSDKSMKRISQWRLPQNSQPKKLLQWPCRWCQWTHWQWANGYMSWKITKHQMLRGFNGQGPLPEISPVPATGIPKAPETKIWIFLLVVRRFWVRGCSCSSRIAWLGAGAASSCQERW